MTQDELDAAYRGYIDCLNARDWNALAHFVEPDVARNRAALGIDGYRAMLEENVAQIPDLRFAIEVLAVQPPWVAARLRFEVTPQGEFMGLPVDGRTVTFWENAFYRYREGRIAEVRTVIDKAAIEDQLG